MVSGTYEERLAQLPNGSGLLSFLSSINVRNACSTMRLYHSTPESGVPSTDQYAMNNAPDVCTLLLLLDLVCWCGINPIKLKAVVPYQDVTSLVRAFNRY